MKLYEEFNENNELVDKISKDQLLVMNRILIKDKINSIFQSLNEGKIEIHQDSTNKSTEMNEIELNQGTIQKMLSEPANSMLKDKIQVSERENLKRINTTSHILKNRRKIIQQTIDSAHHAKILNSAKTGNPLQ
jgi:hypothetical protein